MGLDALFDMHEQKGKGGTPESFWLKLMSSDALLSLDEGLSEAEVQAGIRKAEFTIMELWFLDAMDLVMYINAETYKKGDVYLLTDERFRKSPFFAEAEEVPLENNPHKLLLVKLNAEFANSFLGSCGKGSRKNLDFPVWYVGADKLTGAHDIVLPPMPPVVLAKEPSLHAVGPDLEWGCGYTRFWLHGYYRLRDCIRGDQQTVREHLRGIGEGIAKREGLYSVAAR